MNCEMLNYKSTQNVQPMYDYYIETDLDSVDDQPVDYSKKYTDQDSYEHCQPIKSPLKPDEFPNDGPRTIKQSSSDEVKVYCIEGTPLAISLSSSLSDLREIGTSSDVEKCKRNRLSSSATDGENIESFELSNKNCSESPGSQIGITSPSKEKEGKIVSFSCSNEISKASSPLMFSRSSSIASLNSFEQHSFVDDRSSVSAFSALTSGLISPSDLPDSPGGIMSPALTDKDSSPKINVTEINFNSKCEDRFTEKDEIGPEKSLDNVTHNPISIHSHLTQANEYIAVDLFKSGSKNSEENEDLMERLDVSNDSLDADEVFDDTEFNKKPYLQSREVERKKENIVVLLDSDGKEENIFVNREIVSVKIIKATVEKEKLKIDDDINSDNDSDDELLQNCIQSGMPVDKSKKVEENTKEFESQYSPLSTNNSEKDIGNPIIKSDEESDGDDDLIQQAILRGLPTKSSEKKSQQPCKIMEYHNVPVKTNILPNLGNSTMESDEDSDGDDGDLIQQAILRGLPTKSSEKKMSQPCEGMEYRDVPVKTNILPNVDNPNIKSDEDSDGDEDLIRQAILRGLPAKSSEKKISQQSCKGMEYHDVPVKTNILPNVGNQTIKSDDDSDADDDDLVRQAILRGMPTKSPQKKMSQQPCKTMEYHDVPVKTNILPHTVQMRMPKDSDKRLSVNTEELIKSKYKPHPMSYSPMNVNNKVYPIRKIMSTGEENGPYLLNDTQYNKMQMHRESGNKKRLLNSAGSMNSGYNSHHSDHYYTTNANCRMCPVKRVPNTHENPYFPSSIKVQMSREPVSKERLHSGVSMMPEYNTHPTNCCCVNRRHDSYGIQLEMARESDEKKRLDSRVPMNSGYNSLPVNYSSLNKLRDRYPDGTSDGDEDCKLLENCIKSGMPSPKTTSDFQKKPSPQTGRTLHDPRKLHTPRRPCTQESSIELNKKKNHSRPPQNQPSAPVYSNPTWISSSSYIEVDSMRIYRTEDTPVLSPTASISDLSSLSFNESFLNNSRNSDFSSGSDEDDELLQGVIMLGMPEAKRAVA